MQREIDEMREQLARYIEATYHLSHPKTVAIRLAGQIGLEVASSAMVRGFGLPRRNLARASEWLPPPIEPAE